MFKRQGPLSNDEEGAEHFCAEYDPLEYLLISIIDAYPTERPSRKTRLKHAYEALTGKRRDRVDEPDGEILKAAWEITKLEERNYNNQLLPEYRNPDLEPPTREEEGKEKTIHKMIVEHMDEVLGESNLEDYLKQRYAGRYNNKRVKREKEGFHLSMIDRYLHYRAEEEMELRQDIAKIKQILEKYGFNIDSDRPFWRLPE